MLALKGEKRILVLSVVLLALILLYVLGLVFSPASRRRREMETPLFQILNKEMIARIEIAADGESLSLRRTEDDWTVLISGVYFPAAKDRVDAFLDHVISLKQSKRVSGDPETWSDFEVGDPPVRRLVLEGEGGKPLVNLVIGKPGLAGQGTYVRRVDEEEVIQVDKSFSYYLNPEPRFWSDLKLFPRDLEARDIRRVSLKRRSGFAEAGDSFAYSLVRDENLNWIVEGRPAIPLDNRAVDGLTGALASFEGTEFVVGIPREAAGFDSPAAEVLFTTDAGREFRLLVGNPGPDADQYYVCLEGETYCYLAAAWRLKNILKDLSSLGAEQDGGQASRSPSSE
jgi:hypothetical protein